AVTVACAVRSDSATPTAAPPAIHGIASLPTWTLRSKHFVHGMPIPTDGRHFSPERPGVPGISVLVREGFVVGHLDKHKVPGWVSYRWTEADYRASETVSFERPTWRQDQELPAYARA